MPKLSNKKCHEILLDEKKASKEYARLGFPKQAADELAHYKFFKKKCSKQ